MYKFVATAGIILSAFAAAAPAYASFDDQFRCDPVGDGEHLVIMSARDANKASVQYSIVGENSGESIVTTQLKAVYNFPESGARYTGGEYMLLLTNSNAVLLYGIGSENEGHTECSFVGEGPSEEGQPAEDSMPAIPSPAQDNNPN